MRGISAIIVLAIVLPGCARPEETSVTERSRSPFHTPPAQIAMDQPCRFMGTFHKESRRRVESLAECDAITDPEWSCLARTLKALDVEYTGRCKQAEVAFATIERAQRAGYRACFAEPDAALVACGLLSSGDDCLQTLCHPEAPEATL